MKKYRNTLRKQRIMGIVMLIVTFLIALTGEGTAILFTLPLGLAMLLSKKVFIFED